MLPLFHARSPVIQPVKKKRRFGRHYRAVLLAIGVAIGVSICVAISSVPNPIVLMAMSNLVVLAGYAVWLRGRPHLVRLLGDPDRCDHARTDLVKMGAEAVPILIDVLEGPSGKAQWGRWNADLARREAAEALGELKSSLAIDALVEALTDSDLELRMKAVSALARIGTDRAISILLPCLMDRKLSGYVAAALRQTGNSYALESFSMILEGDCTTLKSLASRYGDGVVLGLLRALDDPAVDSAVNAAHALGELGGVRALPALRAKTAVYSPAPARLKQACREAAARLEVYVGLPRESQSDPRDRETLPRAPESGSADAGLPRVIDS